MSKYLLNCFLLAIPVLIWNLLLTDKLPAVFRPAIFWKDIPLWVKLMENISRSLLFLLMFLFPLCFNTSCQKRGLFLYLTGLFLYFSSWLLLIYLPETYWSQSPAGFLAPAYTPLIWLAGIGMTGGKPFIPLPFLHRTYFLIAVVFTCFHCGHTYVIFQRNKVSHGAYSSGTLPGMIVPGNNA